jgi:ribonuclease HI
VVLVEASGDQVKYMVHLEFKATNNMAEYEALIFGLSAALSLGIRQILVKGDSQLIIKQVRGECSYKEPRHTAYLLYVRKMEKDFIALELQHVPRANNSTTDELSTTVADAGRKFRGAKRPHESHDFLVRQVHRPQGISHIVATSEI